MLAETAAVPPGPQRELTQARLLRAEARWFDGDPWVKKESPVSSIDRKVTKAVLGVGDRLSISILDDGVGVAAAPARVQMSGRSPKPT